MRRAITGSQKGANREPIHNIVRGLGGISSVGFYAGDVSRPTIIGGLVMGGRAPYSPCGI